MEVWKEGMKLSWMQWQMKKRLCKTIPKMVIPILHKRLHCWSIFLFLFLFSSFHLHACLFLLLNSNCHSIKMYGHGQAEPTNLVSWQIMYLASKKISDSDSNLWNAYLWSFSHKKLVWPEYWTEKLQHLEWKTGWNQPKIINSWYPWWGSVGR